MKVKHESYAQRIMSLQECDTNTKKKQTMIQEIFQVKNTEMKMVSLNKVQFAGLNKQDILFFVFLSLRTPSN